MDEEDIRWNVEYKLVEYDNIVLPVVEKNNIRLIYLSKNTLSQIDA